MTAVSVHHHYADVIGVRRPRARGLDLLVMRLSLAMMGWARRHADSRVVGYEEHTRMRRDQLALERRDRESQLLITRVH